MLVIDDSGISVHGDLQNGGAAATSFSHPFCTAWNAARACADRTIKSMAAELHPLVQTLIRRSPAGMFLDAAALRFRPEPGVIRDPLGPETEAALVRGRDLKGHQLIASTTGDADRIADIAANANPSVVRALCLNPRLPRSVADEIAKRAVANKDAALAMALVRGRADIGELASTHGPLFDYLSLRDGHGAVGVLANTVLRMTPSEYRALGRVTSGKAPEVRKYAAIVVVDLVRGGHSIHPEVLGLVGADLGGWHGLHRFRATRGLRAEIHQMSEKAQKSFSPLLDQNNPTSSGFRRVSLQLDKHQCTESSMSALAGAVGITFESDGSWESWSSPVETFLGLSSESKRAAMTSSPTAAEEMLYHCPEFRKSLTAEDLGGMPIEIVEIIAAYPDSHEVVRNAAVSGLLLVEDGLLDILTAVLPEQPEALEPSVLAVMLDACFSGRESQTTRDSLLDRCDTMSILAATHSMRNEGALAAVRQRMLLNVALDPFAKREWLDGLVDLRCKELNIADWAQPALEWAADLFIEGGIEIRNIDVLVGLAGRWTLTVPELVSTVVKL